MIEDVIGNYKIVEKIGEGGMGSVFRGIDMMLEREVAIKMLRPEFASQPNVVERFRTEAVTLAKLSHPNIATLHSFFRQRDDFFMVMEFVRGETLDSIIRRSGAMTLDHTLPLFCQSLDGIGYAHRMGIIHRDIKSANMMLTPEGSIKVMDFGIARVLGTARMTRQGAIVGTIEYMSPEQVRGEEGDARSDVYSLGLLLYEMLTGRLPFNSTSEFELMKAQTDAAPPPPRTFVAGIPLEVEQAIMRSLAKRAEARYQTAGEFRAALVTVGLATASGLDNAMTIPPPLPPRVTQRTDPPSTHGEVLKETRLGTNPMLSSATDNQIRETRLGHVGSVQSVYVQSATDYIGSEPQMTQSASVSRLSRLNWKHYSIGTVLLLILVGGALAVIGVGRHTTSPRGPGGSEPTESSGDNQPKLTENANVQAPGSASVEQPKNSTGSLRGDEHPQTGQSNEAIELIPPPSNTRMGTGKKKDGKGDSANRKREEEIRKLLNKP
jgi:serine/threonine-protein kinase